MKKHLALAQRLAFVFTFLSSVMASAQTDDAIFWENQGQVVDTLGQQIPFDFYAQAAGSQVYIDEKKVAYVLADIDTSLTIPDTLFRYDMNFLLTHPLQGDFIASGQSAYYHNFYYPHCSQGITNVHAFEALESVNIWQGVDIKYGICDGGMMMQFLVHPEYPTQVIQWIFDGPDSVEINPNGYMVVYTPLGPAIMPQPVAYQGSTQIDVDYIQVGNIFKLNVGTYDGTKPLYIEWCYGGAGSNLPNCDDWITYFGGVGIDEVQDVFMDGSVVYYLGRTWSIVFPTVTGTSIDPTFNGTEDCFISKFDANGNSLWGTFYGGSDTDIPERGTPIADSGYVAITGTTRSSNFPKTTTTPFYGGTTDAFLLVIDTAGTSVVFSELIGGNKVDWGRGVAVDDRNHIYVCGETWSDANFPIMSKQGAYNDAVIGGPIFEADGFVAEFTLGGTGGGSQVWGTYFGGGDEDGFWDIDTIADNGIVLVGHVFSATTALTCSVPANNSWFPICDPGAGAYQQDFNLGGIQLKRDNMIVEFDSSGALVWSTYFGGSGNEWMYPTISVSPFDSNVFVIGTSTVSLDFPVTGGGYQDSVRGTGRKFYAGVALFDQRNLSWSTAYGDTSGSTYSYGVDIGRCNFIYLAGKTLSANPAGVGSQCVPPTDPAEFPICKRPGMFFQEDAGGNPIHYGPSNANDGFLAIFDTGQGLAYSGWLGSDGDDVIWAIASDDVADRVYLGGGLIGAIQFKTLDPPGNNYQQNIFGGGLEDAFIARLCVNCSGVVGLADIVTANDELRAYPNPSKGIVYLKGIPRNGTIRVFDVNGKPVAHTLSNDVLVLTRSAPGIYLIQVTGQDYTANQKIVIQ